MGLTADIFHIAEKNLKKNKINLKCCYYLHGLLFICTPDSNVGICHTDAAALPTEIKL